MVIFFAFYSRQAYCTVYTPQAFIIILFMFHFILSERFVGLGLRPRRCSDRCGHRLGKFTIRQTPSKPTRGPFINVPSIQETVCRCVCTGEATESIYISGLSCISILSHLSSRFIVSPVSNSSPRLIDPLSSAVHFCRIIE